MGTLGVGDNALQFTSKREKVRITGVTRVSYGKQGRDFVNTWVKAECENGQWMGWRGFLGGPKELLDAVRHLDRASR